MKQHDKVLQMYADNGLRTAADWATLGRDVEEGAVARTDTAHRRELVSLFSRDQTRPRVSTRPARRAARDAAVAAAAAAADVAAAAPNAGAAHV